MMGDAPRKLSPQKSSSGFGGIKQVSLAVSIGFPLLAIGVLMLALLVVSWVGTAAFFFILAGGLVVAGVLAAASRRVF
jgi:uncharacterized membrane protein